MLAGVARSRALVGMFLGLALAGSLAACTDGDEPDSAPSTSSSGDGTVYVALGDSYTSAPSVGESTGPTGCGQSENNYPHLVAAQLDLDLTDVSCGGAQTIHVTEPQTVVGGGSVPPQADALGPETDLVTLGIGGNDDNYFAGLLTCVSQGAQDPDGSPCTEFIGSLGPREEALAGLRANVVDKVGATIDVVVERAPEARVLVVGYPHLAPAEERCDQFPVAEGDVALVGELVELLSDAVRQAAQEHEVEYVDRYTPTEGHDACASDAWVAGASPTAPGVPFHPYAAEQEAAAAAVVEVIEAG